MPQIASSVIAEDSVQIDGRHWIREQHFDAAGNLLTEPQYLAEIGTDVAAVMARRAADWNAEAAANG